MHPERHVIPDHCISASVNFLDSCGRLV